MLKITIELESALTGKTKILGRMYIWNRGLKDSQESKNKQGYFNYSAAICRKGTEEHQRFAQSPQSIFRTGEVLNYPSDAYPVWRLVTKALKSCFSEEK